MQTILSEMALCGASKEGKEEQSVYNTHMEIIPVIEEYILAAGIWGPLIYLAVMVVAIVISPIPSTPLVIFSGAAFGVWQGIFWSWLGAFIGATIAFYIARMLGRPVVLKLVDPKKLERIERVFPQRRLGLTVFVLRFFPLPFFDGLSYAAGLTHISFRTFALSTALGLVPLIVAFGYVGEALLQKNATTIVVALTAFVGFVVFGVWWAKRAIDEQKRIEQEEGESRQE